MRRNKKKVRYVFIDEEEKKENKSLRADAIIEENKDAAQAAQREDEALPEVIWNDSFRERHNIRDRGSSQNIGESGQTPEEFASERN